MGSRAAKQRHELEVQVVSEPSWMAAECFVTAYDRVAPMVRRAIVLHRDTTTAACDITRLQAGGAHG